MVRLLTAAFMFPCGLLLLLGSATRTVTAADYFVRRMARRSRMCRDPRRNKPHTNGCTGYGCRSPAGLWMTPSPQQSQARENRLMFHVT